MKKIFFPTILAALVAVQSCQRAQVSVETTIEVPVGVIEVSNSSIEEYINTTGTVYPMQEVTLSSEIAGDYELQTHPATGKPYALGDRVEKGMDIIKLEDEEYYTDLRLKSREVDFEVSKQEYEKQKSLYEKGGATYRELKDAEIGLINAEYEKESSRIDLAKMSVTAPFTGTISYLPYFTQGTRVPSGTEMVKLIDYKTLYLETSLPAKYYGNIEKGFKVYVTSYTNPEDTLMGMITQISPEIDPTARTFACFVEVDNSGLKMQPGMFVKADMVVNSSENTLVIPKDIIISFNRMQMVYVVDKGTAHARYITTGLENDEFIEVKTGLEAGEVVVERGFETLRDQSKVRIIR